MNKCHRKFFERDGRYYFVMSTASQNRFAKLPRVREITDPEDTHKLDIAPSRYIKKDTWLICVGEDAPKPPRYPDMPDCAIRVCKMPPRAKGGYSE